MEGEKVLEILRQMPGVDVSDGGVKIFGKAVERTYVNNRLLFGEDPTTALKQLEAEEVASIHSYDEVDDQPAGIVPHRRLFRPDRRCRDPHPNLFRGGYTPARIQRLPRPGGRNSLAPPKQRQQDRLSGVPILQDPHRSPEVFRRVRCILQLQQPQSRSGQGPQRTRNQYGFFTAKCTTNFSSKFRIILDNRTNIFWDRNPDGYSNRTISERAGATLRWEDRKSVV